MDMFKLGDKFDWDLYILTSLSENVYMIKKRGTNNLIYSSLVIYFILNNFHDIILSISPYLILGDGDPTMLS